MHRVAALLLACALTACSDCPDRFELAERQVVRPGDAIVLTAPDGELRVIGRERSAMLEVEAHGCRARDDARIVADSTAEGRGLRVVARHADVRAIVPAGAEVIVRHGSGDTEMRALGPTTLTTRGGDTRITQIVGDLAVRAGAGALYVLDVTGDVALVDGPGAIFVERVAGSVRARDGSGGIHLRDVEGDVLVEADGSGAIDARTIGGSLEVRAKRGDLRMIRHDEVAGGVRLPEAD